MDQLIPLTFEVLDELDSFVPSDTRFVTARNPKVHGVVRQGGTGKFLSVTVRLEESEPLRLDRRALDRMTALTRVPKSLLAELPDELIAQTLNAQLRKHWSWFTHAVVQQDCILDWMAPGWEGIALTPSDVVRTCAGALKDNPFMAGPPEGEWPEFRFLLTTEELAHVFHASPRPNDRHQFYLRAQVDLCGWKLPMVEAVSRRLVCSNGMIATVGAPGSQHKLAARTRQLLMEKLRAAAVETVGYIRSVFIPGIERSLHNKADVEQLVHHLPESVATLVRRAHQAEDLRGTRYHLLNAMTRAANYDACPPDWRERLMSLAGQLTVERRCWGCLRSF